MEEENESRGSGSISQEDFSAPNPASPCGTALQCSVQHIVKDTDEICFESLTSLNCSRSLLHFGDMSRLELPVDLSAHPVMPGPGPVIKVHVAVLLRMLGVVGAFSFGLPALGAQAGGMALSVRGRVNEAPYHR
uniref:Uncharacterized protein n=1 Tax=Knipowitschia caucasica TaxID=637954 RepID=A0AAV2J708_KNICA